MQDLTPALLLAQPLTAPEKGTPLFCSAFRSGADPGCPWSKEDEFSLKLFERQLTEAMEDLRMSCFVRTA